MICKTRAQRRNTHYWQSRRTTASICQGLLLIKSCQRLRYENPGRIRRLAGADNMFRLSGFQQLVICSPHPFLQHSSRQRGAEVKMKATLSANLSGVMHKRDSVNVKGAEQLTWLTSLRGSPRDICSWSSFCSSLRAPMDCWFLAKSESSLSPASVKYFEKCSQLRLLAGNSSWESRQSNTEAHPVRPDKPSSAIKKPYSSYLECTDRLFICTAF